jgi:hypothetical protein
MEKISPSRPLKRTVICVALLLICASAVAAYFYSTHKNKPHKSQELVQSKINFDVDENSCNKRISDLMKTDTTKMVPLDAAKVLGARGNCLLELGRNTEALKTYNQMQKLCGQQTEDNRCGQVALFGIHSAEDALKSETKVPGQ